MPGLIISVLTNKGGTGETTTAVSLGQALAREGKKILVIDNDSQANASDLLLEGEPRYSLYDILLPNSEIPIEEVIYFTTFQDNLYFIPNVPDTASIEPELIKSGVEKGFTVLRKKLRDYALSKFDITLIDNPPNHGIFVINSLYASDFAIVPTEAGSKASIRGLIKAVRFIQSIREEGNSDLRFLRLLITKVDRRTSISHIITNQLKSQFGNDQMFETVIPINTDVQKAELGDQTIFKFNSKAGAAKAYKNLGQELISILDNI
jgi:chromosome partitioning protein